MCYCSSGKGKLKIFQRLHYLPRHNNVHYGVSQSKYIEKHQ